MPNSLTSEQLEILKLFDRDLPEEDWKKLRKVIADFFATRSIEEADKAWDEKGLTDEDSKRILHSHFRSSS